MEEINYAMLCLENVHVIASYLQVNNLMNYKTKFESDSQQAYLHSVQVQNLFNSLEEPYPTSVLSDLLTGFQ
jgi:hypothetical protein